MTDLGFKLNAIVVDLLIFSVGTSVADVRSVQQLSSVYDDCLQGDH